MQCGSVRSFSSSMRAIDPRIANLKPSATLSINERSNAMLKEGKEIYKLGLGQSPFPIPDCMVKELQAHAHEKDYLPVAGLRALRDTYANFLAISYAVDRTGDSVLVGPGSKELLFIAQLAFAAEILLPNPSWVTYEPQAQIAQRQVKWLPTHASERWVLKPQVIEEHCRQNPNTPRLMIFNYPSNPTGCTHTRQELMEIASVARKYGIIILSDEIYGLVSHQEEHSTMAEFYPEGTIISGGLSKAFGAGGWRVGLWSFPKELDWLQHAMTVIASETFTSVAAPLQYAAIRAYDPTCTELNEYLLKSNKACQRVGRWVAQALSDAGVQVKGPEGGFYLFPNFSFMREALQQQGITTSPQLCEKILIETGVAMLPGTDFGRPPEELYLRLAYVDFDGNTALNLVNELALEEDFMRQACPKVATAIDKVCAWIMEQQLEVNQVK